MNAPSIPPLPPQDEPLSADRLSPAERRMAAWAARELKGAEGGVLLEGEKLVETALEAGFLPVAAWNTTAFAAQRGDLVSRLNRTNCRLRQVSDRAMERFSTLETPPGIVVVGPQPTPRFREPSEGFSLIVALTQVQDPGNLGAVIRAAEFFGVDEVWVGGGSADPWAPKALRGAMGATFHLPVIQEPKLLERVANFRRAGAQVWASVAHGVAETSISAGERRILLIGGEARGLTAEDLSLADRLVRLQAVGRSESLNLAVAAGILIYNALAAAAANPVN